MHTYAPHPERVSAGSGSLVDLVRLQVVPVGGVVHVVQGVVVAAAGRREDARVDVRHTSGPDRPRA